MEGFTMFMLIRFASLWRHAALAAAVAWGLAGAARAQEYVEQAGGQADLEFLTSGPIHEAFAELVTREPKVTAVITRRPPELVQELPPDVKPADDAVWIPGYWTFDDDRNDFVWV